MPKVNKGSAIILLKLYFLLVNSFKINFNLNNLINKTNYIIYTKITNVVKTDVPGCVVTNDTKTIAC